MTKWIIGGLVVLLMLGAGYLMLPSDDYNQRVAEEIRAEPDGERARKTVLVTLADGRMYPVNFLWEGNQVFMGIDGFWWREFVETPKPVQVFIRGQVLSGRARTVLDNPDYIADKFSRLRPTVPAWLPDWLNGKLVVIDLDAVPGK